MRGMEERNVVGLVTGWVDVGHLWLLHMGMGSEEGIVVYARLLSDE